MGGCIGSHRDSSPSVSIGKNQPLKGDKPKWKSDIPLTDSQLTSKREEFWDTAPAFDGKKEIWDALKAAAYALETGDHQLAQAIIDGASITLPTGTLLDCYDELGARYQLPVYVLSPPSNLLEDPSEHTNQSLEELAAPANKGSELVVKFRLCHTQKDIKLTVCSTDSVYKIKRMIAEREEGVEANHQKWCFGGRIISDKLKIEDAKLPKGCLVQVIVAEPFRDTEKQPGS